MSKDIRSYFTVLSKKKKDDESGSTGSSVSEPRSQSTSTSSNIKKKSRKLIDSDDEDIIPPTPPPEPSKKEKQKIKNRALKRQVLSDSDDEETQTTKKIKSSSSSAVEEKKILKPAKLDDVFPNRSIKQSKVPDLPPPKETQKKTPSKTNKKGKKQEQPLFSELGIHDDPDFDKTLMDLDEEELIKQAYKEKQNNKEKEHNQMNGSSSSSFKKKSEENESKHNRNQNDDDKKEDIPKREEEKTPTTKKRQRKDSSSNTPKKTKMDHTDSGIDPDQERFEKKRYSAMLYQQYLHRGGPKHHGQKELPKGNPNCLSGLTFLRTGVLDSLESEEFNNLITKHGGRVVHGVSKKVNYVVVGDDPGPAKLEKAKNYNIPLINEDELLDLILTKSGKPPKYCNKQQGHKSEDYGIEEDIEEDKSPEEIKEDVNEKLPITEKTKEEIEEIKSITMEETYNETKGLPLTEKYRPTTTKNLIGQQGDRSNMNKLKIWLMNWYKNRHQENKKSKFRIQSDDGANFKAALLSGPPGIGKTTTAHLVAKELGLDVVEFNASDTRNKKSLHEQVYQLLSTQTIAGYATGDSKTNTRQRVLLMDEVDGMSGNEDRGGMQELINLIKNTQVPIICMCNDRNHQKMRSLVYYCYDLRFHKPKMEQIRGAMMSICFREGIKISPNALGEIISGTGCDIRQTLNHIALLSASKKSMTMEEAKKEAESAKKDTVMGQWEVCRAVFTENNDMSLADRSRLFFYDYSIGPLFVQENYLKVQPSGATNKKEALKKATLAAQSISMGDLISSTIRGENNWALLESQAFFSSVIPGHFMCGQFKKPIDFPSWLGKNSKRRKLKRLLAEIHAHTRTMISTSKEALNLDYIVPLTEAILSPLKHKGMEGIQEAIEIMQNYGLLREDLDSLVELYSIRKKCEKNPMMSVEPRIKSAFTRAYNKIVPTLPYASKDGVSKKNKIKDDVLLDDMEEMELLNEEEEENKEDDDIEHDAFIKKKNSTSKVTTKTKETASTSTKGGRGKGKGKGKK